MHTVMAKNIGTLGKYDQRRLWKLIILIFYLLSHKSNFSLDNKNLKEGGGGYHYEMHIFIYYTLATINATLLFNTFWKLHFPV